MTHTAPLLALTLLLAALAGCAATPPPPPPQPVRVAVIGSPALGGDSADPDWPADALLLEAVTWVSAETRLDAVILLGPLFAEASPAAVQALTGALGSVACPVVVAVAAGDLDPGGRTLERLEAELPSHPGQAAYGRVVADGQARVAAADPEGTGGGSATAGQWSIRAEAGAAGEAAADLVIRPGARLALTPATGDAPARLEVPPLASGVVAVATLSGGGALTVEALDVKGGPAPEAVAPIQLER